MWNWHVCSIWKRKKLNYHKTMYVRRLAVDSKYTFTRAHLAEIIENKFWCEFEFQSMRVLFFRFASFIIDTLKLQCGYFSFLSIRFFLIDLLKCNTFEFLCSAAVESALIGVIIVFTHSEFRNWLNFITKVCRVKNLRLLKNGITAADCKRANESLNFVF